MMLPVAAVVLAVLTVQSKPAEGQYQSDPSVQVFSGEVSPGAWLRIRNLRGTIDVRETTSRNVLVSAVRRLSQRTSEEVTFDVRRDGSNVTVCVIARRTTRCDATGYDYDYDYRRRNEGGIERVDFTVSLPKGVKLVAATGNGAVSVRNAGAEVDASSGNGDVSVIGAGGRVRASSGNGDLEVEGAHGDVQASTGNGDIKVATSVGPVSASSGNGAIDVAMASLSGDDDMKFSTGNGSIDVSFPSNLSATVEASVPFRKFQTDFPLEMASHWDSRRIEGKIGGGGRRIRFSTGNGRVRIHRNG